MTRIILFLGILITLTINGYSQSTDDTCRLRIRIVNKSKYKIEKLIINKSIQLDSIDSKAISDFICTNYIYNSLSYDITFTKKRFLGKPEWAHVISYPIDYIGEKEINEGNYELLLTISKIGDNKYEINFNREKITTGYNTRHRQWRFL